MFFAQTIFSQLTALLLLAFAGWVMARTGKLTDEKPLNALLANAALPALIIANLQAPYSVALLKDMGMIFGGMMVIFLAVGWPVGALAARLAGKTGQIKGAWIACIVFPNAVFMAQPILSALYGEETLVLIAPVTLAFNLTCYTFGGWLLSGDDGAAYRLRQILLTPAVVSCFLGLRLFFLPFRLPGAVLSPLKMLAATTTPISMIIIGCQLARISPQSLFLDGEIYVLSLVRLVLTALISHGVLRLFISDPTILGVLTICASMPSAAILPIVAGDRGGDSLLCSKTVLISTVLCVFTVPFLMQLLLNF
jgi:predicted permease